MDKELLDLLNNARQSGANETQLQSIVDAYNVKKKGSTPTPSPSLNGQLLSQKNNTQPQPEPTNPAPQKSSVYDMANSVPTFHVKPVTPNPNTIENNFNLPSHNQLAAENQVPKDNTSNIVPSQAIAHEKYIEEKPQIEKEKIQTKEDAIDNGIQDYFKNKKIKAPKGSALYNQQKANVQAAIDNGLVVATKDKITGKPGLYNVTGFWDNAIHGFKNAVKGNEDNADFVNNMTPEQQVESMKQSEQETHIPGFAGERPSLLGSTGDLLGSGIPFLGKAAAGAVVGSALAAAAPETGGISLAGLPAATSFFFTAPDMINGGAADEIKRRFQIIKQQNPGIPDVDAMKQANEGKWMGGLGGLATAAAFSGSGVSKALSPESKDVITNALDHVLKPAAHVAAITGATTGAVQEEGNLEGIKTSQSDILKNIASSVKENGLTALALNGIMHYAPKVLNSAYKFALVKDENPQDVQEVLQANEKAGNVPEGTTEKTMQDLNDYKDALTQTPDGLTPGSQASYAGLIIAKNNLQKEALTKDVNAQELYQTKIDAINGQLKKIIETNRPFEAEVNENTGKTYAEEVKNTDNAQTNEVQQPTEVASPTNEKTSETTLPTTESKTEDPIPSQVEGKDALNKGDQVTLPNGKKGEIAEIKDGKARIVVKGFDESGALPTRDLGWHDINDLSGEKKNAPNANDGFVEAGNKSKEAQDPSHLGKWIVDNAKVGDEIKFPSGNGYEIVNVSTSDRTGRKTIEVHPFEINEDGSKMYGAPTILTSDVTPEYRKQREDVEGVGISPANYKSASGMFEQGYRNAKGEQIKEQAKYIPKEKISENKHTISKEQTKKTNTSQVEGKDEQQPIVNSNSEVDKEKFISENPHSGGALTGNSKKFDELPDNSEVWVFTATTPENAKNIIEGNGEYKPELQGQNIKGESDKIYVGSDPRVVSGLGKTIVAFKVKKSDLGLSPEAEISKQTLGRAVITSATGAILKGKPIESHIVENQTKYNESSKEAFDVLQPYLNKKETPTEQPTRENKPTISKEQSIPDKVQEDKGVSFNRKEQNEAFNGVRDIDNNDPKQSFGEYISSLFGVKNSRKSVGSEYYNTDRKINGKDVVIRVSNHPHVEDNKPRENDYTVSIIVNGDEPEGLHVNKDYAELNISANKKNVGDKIHDLYDHFDEIEQKAAKFKEQNPLKEQSISEDKGKPKNKPQEPIIEQTVEGNNQSQNKNREGEVKAEEPKAEVTKEEPPIPPKTGAVKEGNGEENKVGVSHESLNKLAEKLGLEPIKRGQRYTPEEYANRGRQLLNAGADIEQLVKDFKEGKQPTADDISVARAHLEDLKKIADAMGKKWGYASEQYKNALKDYSKFSTEIVKPMGTEASIPFTALQGERDLDTGSFTSVKKAFEDNSGKPATKEQEKRIIDLTKENEDLRKKAKALEDKLIEETDKNVGEGKETERTKTIKEKAKNLADKFRKLKTKPFTFKDENGNDIEISKAGIGWNDLVELGAQAIEKTGEIADGVAAIIEKIKDSDFFSKLSDNDKEKFKDQLTKHYENVIKDQDKKAELMSMFADRRPNDKKFTPDEAKSIWKYAKEEYIDKGIPYRDMISMVGNDLGMSFDQVYSAITSKKLKPVSDEMWKKQRELRLAKIKTEDFVNSAGGNIIMKKIKQLSSLFRGVAVFGHGGIFVGTHAGMTLFDLPRAKYTIKALFNAYKFAYGDTPKYERSMAALESRTNYTLAQRSGLQNEPNVTNVDEYQKYQKVFGKLGQSGVRGFNAIKVLRQDLFDSHFNNLSLAEKADPQVAKEIAHLVNNATGGTNIRVPNIETKSGDVLVNPKEIFFAIEMEAARWEKLTSNPLKATSIALNTIFNKEKTTPSQKVFAKIWAKRVGSEVATYASLLLANAAIQNVMNPKNQVNIFNPSDPEWLKFKFGDKTVDMSSGMLSALGFMGRLGQASIGSQKALRGDTRLQAMGKASIGYTRGKLSPLAGTVADFLTQTDYGNNPLPFSSDKPRTGKHTLTWAEYGWEKAPIPIADAAKEVYDGMKENGMSKPDIEKFWSLATLGKFGGAVAEAGTTGFRISDSYEKHSKFTDEDKKSVVFKYFIDKGLDLPEVSNSNINVPIKRKKIKEKLSDQPLPVQEEYVAYHKDQLKAILGKVVIHKMVYMDEYGSIALNRTRSGQKPVPISRLSKDDLKMVLSLAQREATAKTTKEFFPK